MITFFRHLFFLTILFSIPNVLAQGKCLLKLGGTEESSPKLRTKYNYSEIKDFVLKNDILPAAELRAASQEVILYRLGNEDMGNSFFLAVLEKLGPKPSLKKDSYIRKFLSPVFDLYLTQFKKFTEEQTNAFQIRVPNLYGLKKYGYATDKFGMISWNKATSKDLISKIESIILRQSSIDLNEVNQVLVQLGYIHSILSQQNKMTLRELQMASHDFEASLAMGHSFVPTIGEWDIANINAEWYLNVTVNMLPPKFDQQIDVHGGLSTIEGLSHDHGHFFSLRLRALTKILNINEDLQNPEDRSKVEQLDRLLKLAIQQALKTYHRQKDTTVNPDTLTNTLFFFIHQPEPLQIFLTGLQNGETNWNANSPSVISLAHEMRLQLEKNQEFYPNLGKKFNEFELAARYLIQLLGPASKPIQDFLNGTR